eukprot:8646667-Lingulodinium_polyedra.AAC.1
MTIVASLLQACVQRQLIMKIQMVSVWRSLTFLSSHEDIGVKQMPTILQTQWFRGAPHRGELHAASNDEFTLWANK